MLGGVESVTEEPVDGGTMGMKGGPEFEVAEDVKCRGNFSEHGNTLSLFTIITVSV
jgi:hypothetical protein